MFKIGVIGQREKIVFWQALGLKIFSVQKGEEVKNILEKIRKEKEFGLIFIDDQYRKEIQEEIFKECLPVIIALPMVLRPEKKIDILKEVMKRAIGKEEIILK